MPIEDVLRDPIKATPKVEWETKTDKSPGDVARERIREYFKRYSGGNTASAFVRYELEAGKLNFLYRFFGISPIYEEWIHGNGDGETIFVTNWDSRKIRKSQLSLNDYLDGANAISVHFMYETHDNGNFVAERKGNTTRIGVLPRDW